MSEARVCVITGTTSGIGAAIAEQLTAAGLRLVLHGRQHDKLAAQAERLGAIYVVGELTDPALPGQLLEAALDTYGRCDVAVNNAGTIEVGPVESIDIERVVHMAEVNVSAAYRFIYTFVRHFKAQNAGDLVNISSVMGTKTRPYAGAYSGTKFALEALAESLRLELARTPVRISCIQPGLVETELQRDWSVPAKISMNVAHPLTPEDVAAQVLYVISQRPGVKIPRLMLLPQDHEI